jgi:hypothetical protein
MLRIQAIDICALGFSVKYELTHQLPRSAAVLDTPARMSSSDEQARHTGFSDDWSSVTWTGHKREVASLLGYYFAVAQVLGDKGEVVKDIIAARLVAVNEVTGPG